jgi:para-nitrobenzyl esterase
MKRNSRLFWLLLTLTCLLGCDLGAAGAGARSPGHSDPEPIVMIDGGPVKGMAVPGGYVFRALPYAAPPTGRLRW